MDVTLILSVINNRVGRVARHERVRLPRRPPSAGSESAPRQRAASGAGTMDAAELPL